MAHDKFKLNQIQLSSREIGYHIHKLNLILLSQFKILQFNPQENEKGFTPTIFCNIMTMFSLKIRKTQRVLSLLERDLLLSEWVHVYSQALKSFLAFPHMSIVLSLSSFP